MRAVYITQEGAIVRREGGVLHVFSNHRKVADVPVHDLEQLVLMGNIMVTPSVIDLLLDREVDTVFLTLHGKYRGRLVRGLSGSVRLRLAQYRKLMDASVAAGLARRIVRGKIANMRTFMMRFARRHGDTPKLSASIRGMRAAMERVELADNLDSIRGCEGSASAAYFRAFGEMIRAEGFHFDGRNRRPPMDPVNALLSLGYTLLSNAVEAAVNIVGFDPCMGALHAVESGRPSLVCDMVEEFRAPVVDALVIASINRGLIQTGDFEDAGPGEPVIIRREALGVFIRAFEQRMETVVIYDAPEERKLQYRQVVEQQARRLARFLLDAEPAYEPFIAR